MMEFQYKEILLQALMVLFPLVLFLAFSRDGINSIKRKLFLGLTCAITMILAFAVAIQIDKGVFTDLRFVPWYIAFLYGGNIIGISVTVFFIIVRYIIGGVGMTPAFIMIITATVVIQGIMANYQSWSLKKRMIFSSLFLSILYSFLFVVGTFMLDADLTYTEFFTYLAIVAENAIIGSMVIYLIESHLLKTQLLKDIHKSEKLNVVGQLAASVAHEIRNPMTSVKGFIQLLSTSNNLSKDEILYLKLCLDELDRANSIIGDYLSLGKEYKPELETRLDIVKEIQRSINSLSSYASLQNVEIHFQANQLYYIKGNSGRLQQLIVNIIKNGIEAIDGNGAIDVNITGSAKSVLISIADNGQGMNQEQIENLGLPFYSTKEKGTGLGLMVSLSIVKELGGNIQVNSSVGKGTTFMITFPRMEEYKSNIA